MEQIVFDFLKPERSDDWKWSFKDYPQEKNGLKVFSCFSCGGGLRKMSFMKDLPRYTVTYCQYGDQRQKPTDIWTNHPNPEFKPPCKRGSSCHIAAPRGRKTGTQGLKTSMERATIPEQLCEHIVDICEEGA